MKNMNSNMGIDEIAKMVNEGIDETIRELEIELSNISKNIEEMLDKFKKIINSNINKGYKEIPIFKLEELNLNRDDLDKSILLDLIKIKENIDNPCVSLSGHGCFVLLDNNKIERGDLLKDTIEKEEILDIRDISKKTLIPEWFISEVLDYYNDNNIISFNKSSGNISRIYKKIS